MAKGDGKNLLERRKEVSNLFRKSDGTASSAADIIRQSLNKLAGEEIALSLDKDDPRVSVQNWIEMPSFFQKAVGGKGFPQGRFTMLAGAPNTGKTSLLMHAMVATQNKGGIAVLLDSERKWQAPRFEAMGGNHKDIIYIPVASLEEAWDQIVELCASFKSMREAGFTAPVLIGWDSVGQTPSKKLAGADSVTEPTMMTNAKINAAGAPRVIPVLCDAQVALIGINQEYDTTPAFPGARGGRTMKGGKALQFTAQLTLKTTKGKRIKMVVNGEEKDIGVTASIQIDKTHLGGFQEIYPFYIVKDRILETEAELAAYKKLLRETVPEFRDNKTKTSAKKVAVDELDLDCADLFE